MAFTRRERRLRRLPIPDVQEGELDMGRVERSGGDAPFRLRRRALIVSSLGLLCIQPDRAAVHRSSVRPLHGADAGHVGRAPEPRGHRPARLHLRADDHGVGDSEERRQPSRLAVHHQRAYTLRVQSRHVRHLLEHRLVPAGESAAAGHPLSRTSSARTFPLHLPEQMAPTTTAAQSH